VILAGGNVTLDAAGRAQLSVGPSRAFETWEVSRVAVQTSGAIKPAVRLYWYSEVTTSFIDGTRSGNADVGEYSPPLHVTPGQSILAVWTGGSVGAIGSITFDGSVSNGV